MERRGGQRGTRGRRAGPGGGAAIAERGRAKNGVSLREGTLTVSVVESDLSVNPDLSASAGSFFTPFRGYPLHLMIHVADSHARARSESGHDGPP